MLIAGADSDKIYGNEYDADIIPTCRKRINRACDILGKPHIKDWQIHEGNALQYRCLTDFGPEYTEGYNCKYKDDLEYAQSKDQEKEYTIDVCGSRITEKELIKQLTWAEENRLAEERYVPPHETKKEEVIELKPVKLF